MGIGRPLPIILEELGMDAEGIKAVKAAKEISRANNLELPIISAIYEIVYNKIPPLSVVEELMVRVLKDEFE